MEILASHGPIVMSDSIALSSSMFRGTLPMSLEIVGDSSRIDGVSFRMHSKSASLLEDRYHTIDVSIPQHCNITRATDL